MKKKCLISLIFILSNVYIIKSQTFTDDVDKFVKEFTSQISEVGEFRKNANVMQKEFTAFWQSDSLTITEKTNFIKDINALVNRSCKTYPDLIAFTDNTMAFCRKKIDRGQYDNYKKYLYALLNDKKTKISEISSYIIDINSFIKKNILSKTSKNYWKIENNSFLIKYEDGLKIQFDNVNLVAYQGRDSLKIYKTSGLYDFKRNSWQGHEGLVAWERVGYGIDSVNAKLSNYKIENLNNAFYECDSVIFNNTLFYKKPMLGKFSDKASNIEHPEKSDYPKFSSYSKRFEMKNLVKGVNYEGGFSINGRRFLCSGTKEEPARMHIPKNDSIYLFAYSTEFYLTRDEIFSSKAKIILHLSKDSIFHPYLHFKYNIEQGLLELIRTKENDMSKVSFRNSYHQVNMDFTLLRWNIDKFLIKFTNISMPGAPNEAMFESNDYYRLEKYKNIQKRDLQHPLTVLTNFAANWGADEFYLIDLATYMKYKPEQIMQMVMTLAFLGYLDYDFETQYIKIYPETRNFLNAHNGIVDSDVIQFYSKTPSSLLANADFSLLNYDLKIKGISNVHLSDSQNIKIYPKDSSIVVRKNRSFTFDGTIQAGQFYFFGNHFKFDYNKFLIDLAQCDSMKMAAETDVYDTKGNFKPALVKNKIEKINGVFFIDEPNNKSGRGYNANYPKFISKDKTYVYFDSKDIQNGIYKRDNFYFEVDPFEKDSIKGYSRKNLEFKGTLHSNILPDIKETLKVRSLPVRINNQVYYILCFGFQTNTDKNGYSIYDKKAKFYHQIDFSNYGLFGRGKIEYVSAKIDMDSILFLPEMMTGFANKFEMSEKDGSVSFPRAVSYNNPIEWDVKKNEYKILSADNTKRPKQTIRQLFISPHLKQDELFSYKPPKDTAQHLDKRFNMYSHITPIKHVVGKKTILEKVKVNLDGNLSLSPKGLKGDGEIMIETDSSSAAVVSKTYDFQKDLIESDEAGFKIFNGKNELNAEVFSADFVNTHINFITKTGYFKRDKRVDTYRFPQNYYICDAYSATWNMGRKDISLGGNKATQQESKITFTSTHPQQDSLKFSAVFADYNFSTYIIKAAKVEEILSADAIIKPNPKNDTVEIYKNAVMKTLYNAQIIANSVTKLHTIYEARVDIKGRKNYMGEGKYDYIDNTKRPQPIFFKQVYPDATGNTYGKSSVDETMNFKLSSNFKYQGDILLRGNEAFLEFSGAAKTISKCDTTFAGWTKFKAQIEPENVYIPIDSVQYNINGQMLNTGIYLNANRKLYPCFLNKQINANDDEIFSSHGFLYFDNEEKKFIIAKKDKIETQRLPGNYMHLHHTICNMYGEGKFTFSKRFGLFKPNAIGNFIYYPDKDTIEINVNMLVDAYFSKDALKLIADSINKTPGLPAVNLQTEVYEKSLIEYLGVKTAEEWLSNLSLGNYNKYPKALADKIILTDLVFYWHKSLNAFVHYGPIGIANLGKEKVNKSVFGFVKIDKSRSGDTFEMLIEPGLTTWYYFRYSAGSFTVVSSDNTLNNMLFEIKDGQKELKENGIYYNYNGGSTERMKSFKKEMYKFFNIR